MIVPVHVLVHVPVHGLEVWMTSQNTHHSCILESSGKELLLVTDQPVSYWSHIHLWESVLAQEWCHPGQTWQQLLLMGMEREEFPRRGESELEGQAGRLVRCIGGRGRVPPSPRRSCIFPSGEDLCKWPNRFCVKKGCEAFRTEFCRRKPIGHLVFLT